MTAKLCGTCSGSRKCYACEGDGKCAWCGGTATVDDVCPHCHSRGMVPCSECEYRPGKCVECDATGMCLDCEDEEAEYE